MASIKEQKTKLKKLTRNKLYGFLSDVFSLNYVQTAIISINQNQLEENGIDSTGEKLRTYNSSSGTKGFYSRYTEFEKKIKGQPINRVTLKDTGDFYNSFNINTLAKSVLINADFSKPDGDISDNLDVSDVLGLTDENLTIFLNKVVIRELNSRVRNYLRV